MPPSDSGPRTASIKCVMVSDRVTVTVAVDRRGEHVTDTVPPPPINTWFLATGLILF